MSTPASEQETVATGRSSVLSYRWAVIIGLFSVVSSAAMLVSLSVGIVLPEMRADLRMSPWQAGALGAISPLANILLGVVVATFVSRYNPRKMIFYSAVMMAALAFLQGWAPTFELEMLFRFIFMTGLVSRQATFAMLIQGWFKTAEVPRVQSVRTVINSSVQIAAFAALPWLLILFGGWRHTFYALAVLMAAAAVLWLVFSRDPDAEPAAESAAATPGSAPEAAAKESTPIRAVFRHRVIWHWGICTAFCLFGVASFSVFWPTYLMEERGLSLRMAGLFAAGIPAGNVVGALQANWIRQQVTARRQQMYITGVVCSASMLLMTLAPVGPLLPLGAFGLGWACMQVFPTIMALPFELPSVKPREIAVLSSFMMSLFTVGPVLGPLVTGTVQQATGSLSTGFLVAAGIHMAIFLIAFASEEGLPLMPRVQRRESAIAADVAS